MAEKLASLRKKGGARAFILEGVPTSNYIKCGFKPKQICIADPSAYGGTLPFIALYSENLSTTKMNQVNNYTSAYWVDITSHTSITSIDNDGFHINADVIPNLTSAVRITVS